MRNITIQMANDVYYFGSFSVILRYSTWHALFEKFSIALRSFERSLGEEARDEYWQGFLRQFKHYWFDHAAAPLPFDNITPVPYSSGLSPQHYLLRCSMIYPQFEDAANNLFEIFEQLLSCSDNPMLDMLQTDVFTSASTRAGIDTALLISEPRLVPRVKSILAIHRLLDNADLISPSYLKGGHCYERMVIFGSPRWFKDYVFNSPRARDISVICYEWFNNAQQTPATFADCLGSKSEPVMLAVEADKPDEISPTEASSQEICRTDEDDLDWLPNINWDDLCAHIATIDGGNVSQETTMVRLCLLEGGSAVFVEDSDDAKVQLLDLDSEGDDADGTNRLHQIPATELEPGMFLILRTSGGGDDYIAKIADRILGQRVAAAHESQAIWKRLLRKEFLNNDYAGVVGTLRRYGSYRANDNNIRNWFSPRSIKPDDYRDFAGIMKLIGLEDKTDEYWANAQAIDRAHLVAGQHIRKQLLKVVSAADLGELEKTGRMDFELADEDGGSLTAFLVVSISPDPYKVPVSRVGRPIERY